MGKKNWVYLGGRGVDAILISTDIAKGLVRAF